MALWDGHRSLPFIYRFRRGGQAWVPEVLSRAHRDYSRSEPFHGCPVIQSSR